MPLVSENAQCYLNFALFSLLLLDFPIKSVLVNCSPHLPPIKIPVQGLPEVTWWGHSRAALCKHQALAPARLFLPLELLPVQ